MMAIHAWEKAVINEFFAGNMANEQEALRAIARILRQGEPLPMDLRRMLADHIDPDKRRAKTRGRPKKVNDLRVAAIVHERSKAGTKKATHYAGVSPRAAENALAKYRKDFRRLEAWGLGAEIAKIANESD
jgi:hypothetical protein